MRDTLAYLLIALAGAYLLSSVLRPLGQSLVTIESALTVSIR